MKKSRLTPRLRVKLRRAMSVAKDFAADKRDYIADLCEQLAQNGPYDLVLYSSGNVEITFGSTAEPSIRFEEDLLLDFE